MSIGRPPKSSPPGIATLARPIDASSGPSTALDARMEAVGNRYKAQFVAMDALVGQMSSTSNYLAQQLASLSNQTG